MRFVTLVLLGLMALEHLYFLNLQMFRWTHASTVKAFKTTVAVAESSKKLAMNQGLYNGFLAAGWIWAGAAPPPAPPAPARCFLRGLRADRGRVRRRDGEPADPRDPGAAGGIGAGVD